MEWLVALVLGSIGVTLFLMGVQGNAASIPAIFTTGGSTSAGGSSSGPAPRAASGVAPTPSGPGTGGKDLPR